MGSQQLLIISAVFIGALFIAASLVLHLRARGYIPDKLIPKWNLICGLMTFFLAGYVFFLIIELERAIFSQRILTAGVFMAGGFFVFLVTRVTLGALFQVGEQRRELEDVNRELQQSNYELVKAYDSTIEGWGHVLDLRDHETEGHSRRVAGMTGDIARKIGLPEKEIVHLIRGALLHDIGKMAIADKVLLKKGKLTNGEWERMRKHPLYAYEMLSTIDYLKPAIDIPYCHHERWDGTGYPRGLKGKEIPPGARIFAIADTWDALISERRYHKPWSRDAACEHIRSGSGSHFDPDLVRVFLEMYCTDN